MRTQSTLYTSFYAAQFLFLGVQLPFFPGWLQAEGLSESDIGWIMGGSLILRLLLGPVVAYWAETQADQRRVFTFITAVMAASSILLLPTQPQWAIGLLTVSAIWAFGCLVPITDTAVMRADKAGVINYGRARGVGSFAFIVANLAGGFIIARYGDDASVWWMAAAASACVLIALNLPHSSNHDSAAGTGAGTETGAAPVLSMRPNLAEAARLFRSRSFVLMLTAVGLTQGAHATYYYFSELHWSQLGYGSDLIGVLWTLGVLAEIVVLYTGRRMIRRFGPVFLIGLGALGAVIRWPLTGLSPPLGVLVFLQMLHALTFATTYLGSVEFISRAVPNSLANTGMTLVSTLGVGALTGVGAILVGQVFSAEAPFAGYLLMGLMGLGGFIASLALARHWDGGLIRSARPPTTS